MLSQNRYSSKKDRVDALGARIFRRFEEYETNRRPTELRWMNNLRQYLGKYDPDIQKNIPKGRSQVYPRDTFVKVTGFVSKMMELLFPANEKNWGVSASPVPNLRRDVVDQIISGITAQIAEQAQRNASSDEIEDAIFKYAEDRARAMDKECSDQLAEMRYVLLAMRVIRSGAIYGVGVAKGPLVTTQEERIWKHNEETESYEAVSLERVKPYFEFLSVWNLYPDLDAKDWRTQEGIFERMVFSKNELYTMLDNDAFDDRVLREFLRANPHGNYVRRSFEGEIDELRGTVGGGERHQRMYEVLRWYGFWPSEDVKGLDSTLEEDDIDEFKDILIEAWMIGGKLFRINKAVLDETPAEFYHAFIYREDEEVSMAGSGLPESIRDSQLSHCAVRRMLIDNAAATAGPILEINTDLLEPADQAKATEVHAFKVFRRKGFGAEANYPVLRDVSVQSHITELLSLSEDIQQRMDIESNMPAWMFGNPEQLGEAFRTSTNMSMMMGGATMGMKAIVRGYDMFTESLIGSLVAWNMEFNERDEIKGDFQVVTRGSTSLVAKELRGAALDQFIETLTDAERKLLKTREVLIDRLQARDLPVDRVVDIERAEEILAEAEAAEGEMSAKMAEGEDAKIRKLLADAGLADARAQALGATADTQAMDAQTRAQDSQIRAHDSEIRAQEADIHAVDVMSKAQREVDKTELESIDRVLQFEQASQGAAA